MAVKTQSRKKRFSLKNLKNAIIVALGGMPNLDDSKIDEVADKLIEKAQELQERSRLQESSLSEEYLFDFRLGYRDNEDHDRLIFPEDNDEVFSVNKNGEHELAKARIKPIDVLDELEKIPTSFSLEFLDQKIAMLKDKEAIIKQEYVKREMKGLIERLENRKKYPEHKAFFDKWDNTDEDKVKALLGKYKELVMEESDLFIPEFPDIAIKRMKDYTEHVEAICSKKPVFYVIAEAKEFSEKEDKRDPILLVQSPFGFYYQILGAWDKEMILLSEL